jgi:hypothetical protein
MSFQLADDELRTKWREMMIVREKRPSFEEVPAYTAVTLNGTGVDVAGDFLCHHPVEVE